MTAKANTDSDSDTTVITLPSVHTKGHRKAHKARKRQARLMNRIRQAFSAEQLIAVCEADSEAFESYGDRWQIGEDSSRFYFHKDNGADVLAVAHLDSVHWDSTASVMQTSAGLLVASGALDDRLGAYVILELLPRLGIHCDILLTTDEEQADSTAQGFVAQKDYRWLIQFDRGGTDVVMYDYETADLRKRVTASGAQVGIGSYSDISSLKHLKRAGFNWGVGYREYHGARSHAWLEDTFEMVARFVRFYWANCGETFEYVPYVAPEWRVRTYGDGLRDGYGDDFPSYREWKRERYHGHGESKRYNEYVDKWQKPLRQRLPECPDCEAELFAGHCLDCRVEWNLKVDPPVGRSMDLWESETDDPQAISEFINRQLTQ